MDEVQEVYCYYFVVHLVQLKMTFEEEQVGKVVGDQIFDELEPIDRVDGDEH